MQTLHIAAKLQSKAFNGTSLVRSKNLKKKKNAYTGAQQSQAHPVTAAQGCVNKPQWKFVTQSCLRDPLSEEVHPGKPRGCCMKVGGASDSSLTKTAKQLPDA